MSLLRQHSVTRTESHAGKKRSLGNRACFRLTPPSYQRTLWAPWLAPGYPCPERPRRNIHHPLADVRVRLARRTLSLLVLGPALRIASLPPSKPILSERDFFF